MADKPSYLQTSAGPTFTRGDTAFVRNRSGEIKTVSSADAARLLEEDPEYLPVSAEQVGARDVEIARSTLGEKAKTLGEAALSTAIDIPLAPGRLAARALGADEKKVERFSGRAAVTQGIGDIQDATSGKYDENAAETRRQEYEQVARERAEVNPGTKVAGEVIGSLPWAAIGPGAAAEGLAAGAASVGTRLAIRGAAGAAEGALLGESQATEDAYIDNKPLTAEKLMASMGWGALIGGGASFALSGASEAAGALKGRFASRVPVDADLEAAAGGARPAPTRAFADPTEQRLGEAAEAAGANPAARQMAAKREADSMVQEAKRADPSDWRRFTREATPEAQYVHRGKVLDLAANETGDELTKVLERAKPIQDEIDNLALKREKVAAHMAADGVDDTAALATAQGEAAGLRERLGELRAQIGAKRIEVSGEEIGPAVKGKARAKAKPSSAEQALNELDSVTREGERRLAAAETGADGVVALDWMRREQARVWRTARNSLQRSPGFEARALLEPTTDFLQREYQRTADLLMDANFVGKTQAEAQGAVNRARVGLINGDKFDLRPFVNQVGSEESAAFGGQVYQGNKDSIRAMLDTITPDGGRLRTDQFERFLKQQDDFYGAVKKSYDLSPANQAKLDELLGSTAKMRDTLDAARNAATSVAKVQARIDADRIAGGTLGKALTGAAVGGAEGGLVGALRGAARGAMGGTENVLRMQEALGGIAESSESKLAGWLSGIVGKVAGTEGAGSSAINAAANIVDSRLDSAMDRFFSRMGQTETKAAKSASRRTIDATGTEIGTSNRDAAKRAAIPLAIRLFAPGGNLREAYDQRVQELQMANRELGAGVRDGVTASMGGLTQSAPVLTAQLAAAASRGAVYLEQHLPAATRAPSVFQPNKRAEISDMALRSFARRWATVANPMTAVEDLQKGTLTYDQVDALKNVYPMLYDGLRLKTMQRLQQLDQRGVTVPYQDRLQLNLLLDLHGAGDPTLTTDFALKVSGLMQAQKGAQQKPHPSGKPVAVAKARMSDSQAIGASLRGA
jgi:hypothetical protein